MKTVPPCFNDSRLPVNEIRRMHGRRHAVATKAGTPVALFVRPEYRDLFFSPGIVSEIQEIAGRLAVWVDPGKAFLGHPVLAQCEVLFCAWGTPQMDHAFLRSMPNLRAVFHMAGEPENLLTKEVLDRGITVTCAQAKNEKPLVEFSTSVILLSLKRSCVSKRERPQDRPSNKPGRTVGLVGLSTIGRGVAEVLSRRDLKVLAYDPFIPRELAAGRNTESARLDRIFSESDVIGIHRAVAPSAPGLIGADLLNRMKPGATLINMARGRIVQQDALCKVLRQREDVSVVLDVTNAEPPDLDSPLWDLPNVFFTTLGSGSLNGECLRMSRFMVDEFRRYSRGIPLFHQVTKREWKR